MGGFHEYSKQWNRVFRAGGNTYTLVNAGLNYETMMVTEQWKVYVPATGTVTMLRPKLWRGQYWQRSEAGTWWKCTLENLQLRQHNFKVTWTFRGPMDFNGNWL